MCCHWSVLNAYYYYYYLFRDQSDCSNRHHPDIKIIIKDKSNTVCAVGEVARPRATKRKVDFDKRQILMKMKRTFDELRIRTVECGLGEVLEELHLFGIQVIGMLESCGA